MQKTKERDLHVTYPDESVTEDIYQFTYDMLVDFIPPNKTVLDVGCGSGALAYRLGDKSKKVIGIDLADERISFANRMYAKPNVSFKVMDALNLSLPDQSVDVVVSVGVVHHLPLESVLKQFRRVLKPGGMIIILDVYERFYRAETRFISWYCMLHRDGLLKTLKTFGKMCGFFFRRDNMQHRKNDQARLKGFKRYYFENFKQTFSTALPGCVCTERFFPFATVYWKSILTDTSIPA